MPPGADPSIVLSAADLGFIDRRIRTALKDWCRVKSPTPLTKDDLACIRAAISPSFRLMPALFRQIDEQEERLIRLTEEQARILEVLEHQKRAAIKGVAGSGKTMLAAAQAQRFAADGAQTLLVCFNRNLAMWLDTILVGPHRDKITVRHFHGLCHDWCARAGIRFQPPEEDQATFWRDKAPDLLWEALDMLSDRFDAIVVDEGQDFFPNWWIPLEELNSQGDSGPLYVFYDPAQALFVKGGVTIPKLGEPFNLRYNCRNTTRIAKVCSDILDQEIIPHPAAPLGVEVRWEKSPTPTGRETLFRQVIEDWVVKGKLKASAIAVLSPRRKPASCLSGVNRVAGIALTENVEDWKVGHGILFTTIRAFKGLEADAVVVVDFGDDSNSPHFSVLDSYVATSRAKHALCVICCAS